MSTSTSSRPRVPEKPDFIWFYHPFAQRGFLYLPKNNILPGTSETFGVHHETALTACQIIACNDPGFLSTSADRNNIDAKASPEILFLTSKKYYYHLVTQTDHPNYHICNEFAAWSFPHDEFPFSWARTTPIDDAGVEGFNMTDISNRIRQRDQECRVSGWVDNRSTAHIVPKEERDWLRINGMDVYAARFEKEFAHRDSRNLFALRRDIHTFQFDSGNFVIVPMNGGMVTHFIDAGRESATRYHNKPFDSSNLSHEFLFARFAWAIIKKARVIFLEYPDAGQRAFNVKAAPLNEDDGDGAQQQSGSGQKRKGTKRKTPGTPESKDPATRDAHELDKDMAKAKKVAPFFLDPEGIANPYAYENMRWYPGFKIVERKKLEYMDAHPNIRAFSGPCASADTDSEGNID